jgi:hypothetical protein
MHCDRGCHDTIEAWGVDWSLPVWCSWLQQATRSSAVQTAAGRYCYPARKIGTDGTRPIRKYSGPTQQASTRFRRCRSRLSPTEKYRHRWYETDSEILWTDTASLYSVPTMQLDCLQPRPIGTDGTRPTRKYSGPTQQASTRFRRCSSIVSNRDLSAPMIRDRLGNTLDRHSKPLLGSDDAARLSPTETYRHRWYETGSEILWTDTASL